MLLAIPNSLTQAIRNFAKNLESWMIPAVDSLPNDLKIIKVNDAHRHLGRDSLLIGSVWLVSFKWAKPGLLVLIFVLFT